MSESSKATILLVDDDLAMRQTLRGLLESRAYFVLDADSAERAIEILQGSDVDLIVTDLRMPGMKGEALLENVRATFPQIPVVAITAFGSVEGAVQLTRAGAVDYLEKPFRTQRFLESIAKALEASASARKAARERSGAIPAYQGLIGASPGMLELYGKIARVGPSNAPALITGESGTGKELVARAVHATSDRDPFLAVNCGAIPATLLESELFGHAKGAFSGATSNKVGLFEAANGGTLFLDEIGELPLDLQPKLLRALESGEVRRVGEVVGRKVDVRIIAATNRDLAAAAEEGDFRRDLYWRLGVLHLELPPLRDHPEDIPLLVDNFLLQARTRFKKGVPQLSPEAMAALIEYQWPGNVRQLRNTLEAMLTFADQEVIGLEDIPAEIRRAVADHDVIQTAASRGFSLAELERDYIFEILRRTEGNKSQAAEILGIPRRTLYRRIESYASDLEFSIPPE